MFPTLRAATLSEAHQHELSVMSLSQGGYKGTHRSYL